MKLAPFHTQADEFIAINHEVEFPIWLPYVYPFLIPCLTESKVTALGTA